jgi:hypothetical protein
MPRQHGKPVPTGEFEPPKDETSTEMAEVDAEDTGLSEGEEGEEIDPENPPRCDGCDRKFPKGSRDSKIAKIYPFDKYKIRICHKCWDKMGPSVRILIAQRWKDDTAFSIDHV